MNHQTISLLNLLLSIWPYNGDVDMISAATYDTTDCQMSEHRTGYCFVVTRRHRRFCVWRHYFSVN